MSTRAVLCLLAICLWLNAVSAQPAEPLGRPAALEALHNVDADVRREALRSLALVGTMEDVPAVAAALHDKDGVAREIAEQASWQIWSRSGDADVDELFALGLRQMRTDPEAAVATYSRIIETRPDFAEGWNKRATLYYMMGRLDESLKDCDEVMKRNPYHFGALSGYGQIYLRLEKYERALDYFMRALKVNPNMDSVRELVRQLRMFLGEQPERYI